MQRQTPLLDALIIDHASGYAISTVDREGTITSWRGGAEAITGYSADEAVGMNFRRLFTEVDQAAGVPERELERSFRDGRAEDTRWHIRRDGRRFWANGLTTAVESSEFTGLVKIFRDETPARLADEQRVLLLNELNHRVKNTLATVQSVVEQTLRTSDTPEAVRRNLVNRIIALSEAHNVLVEQNWAGADLKSVISNVTRAYAGSGPRVEADGPAVRLSPQQAISCSLVLHELTTNAAKYGALTRQAGRVRVSWNESLDMSGGRHLTLLWEETGGPVVRPPERTGFGTKLIKRALK
ncbi:MAG TPA: HWE histidine kinase domain-containing protein, partial [Caulobacteraceae bacterium]